MNSTLVLSPVIDNFVVYATSRRLYGARILYQRHFASIAFSNYSSRKGEGNYYLRYLGEAEVETPIRSISTSNSSQKVCIVTDGKKILLYDMNLNQIQSGLLPRRPTKVRHSNTNEDIVVVSTSLGTLLIFDCKDNLGPLTGDIIFDNPTVITDFVMDSTDDNIIVGDILDKVRVCCFPNCYDIVSFCLAHKGLITVTRVVEDILATAGSDGRLILWDYESGNLLCEIETDNNSFIISDLVLRKNGPDLFVFFLHQGEAMIKYALVQIESKTPIQKKLRKKVLDFFPHALSEISNTEILIIGTEKLEDGTYKNVLVVYDSVNDTIVQVNHRDDFLDGLPEISIPKDVIPHYADPMKGSKRKKMNSE